MPDLPDFIRIALTALAAGIVLGGGWFAVWVVDWGMRHFDDEDD